MVVEVAVDQILLIHQMDQMTEVGMGMEGMMAMMTGVMMQPHLVLTMLVMMTLIQRSAG